MNHAIAPADVPAAVDAVDLDLDIIEDTDSNPNLGSAEDQLRAGGATSTCVTYWSASRCPSCW